MEDEERADKGVIEISETHSRGGYRDEADYTESRKRSQIVRGDFLAATFKAKVTFAYESVKFNMACVKIFPNDQFIMLSVDEPNLRVIAEPCEGGDSVSLKFANKRNEKNIPRQCTARYFCHTLFEMMKWNTQAKYRTLAIEQEFFGKRIIVFNLDECLQVFTETFNETDGKVKHKTIVNMPPDWKGRFGYTPEELETKRKIENTAEFIRIDNKTGEHRNTFIQPKLPTPEELMHRPYGGIRLKTEGDSDEERS